MVVSAIDPQPIIDEIAIRVLDRNPDAVVRYRLLRDVLERPHHAPDLEEARKNRDASSGIIELASEQRPDGSWGPFHSRSTRLKQKIVSTEVGVNRALALGLETDHPILQKAADYILALMNGEIAFPDYEEKNDRWPAGKRLFLASTLSLIRPSHPILDADRALWFEIARRTFKSGAYSQEDESDAHAELTGASVRNSYLRIRGRYQLNILGTLSDGLPQDLEMALLCWLWDRPDGIGYLNVALKHPPTQSHPGLFDHWLTSLELVTGNFPNWVHFSGESIEWIWKQRQKSGFWDFGPRATTSTYMPLSEDWRRKLNRVNDWTTRILILMGQHNKQRKILISPVERFISRVVQWAASRPDLKAIALVGSHARGAATLKSDIDLVILADSPRRYIERTRWAQQFERIERQQVEDWGKVTSLRVWYVNGLEVEFGFAAPDWAALPLDTGTHQVIGGGIRVLYDRSGLLTHCISQ